MRIAMHPLIAAIASALFLAVSGCKPAPPPVVAGVAALPVEISARDLDSRIKAGKAPLLLDVREADERAEGTLPGSKHIPLGELEAKMGELPRDAEIVVFCRSGRRSGRAVETLRAAGYTKARSLTGGLNDWSSTIGPVPRP